MTEIDPLTTGIRSLTAAAVLVQPVAQIVPLTAAPGQFTGAVRASSASVVALSAFRRDIIWAFLSHTMPINLN
jgi:hypothetical protein